MGLISSLQQEHAQIKAIFNEVKLLGIETEEGREKFNKGKSLLLAHLKKEDEQLYPSLEKLVAEKQIASDFQVEMKEITKAALAFFAKYDTNNLHHGLEFSSDLGKFIGVLNTRIRKEEVTLYPKYERHCL